MPVEAETVLELALVSGRRLWTAPSALMTRMRTLQAWKAAAAMGFVTSVAIAETVVAHVVAAQEASLASPQKREVNVLYAETEEMLEMA